MNKISKQREPLGKMDMNNDVITLIEKINVEVEWINIAFVISIIWNQTCVFDPGAAGLLKNCCQKCLRKRKICGNRDHRSWRFGIVVYYDLDLRHAYALWSLALQLLHLCCWGQLLYKKSLILKFWQIFLISFLFLFRLSEIEVAARVEDPVFRFCKTHNGEGY